MLSKKRSRLSIMISVVTLFTIFMGLLIYFKFFGLNRALKDLVYSKTNGQYSLVIGHSSINILKMTLSLNDIKIQRNPDSEEKGIRSVTITHIKIHITSLITLFEKGQFDIKEFTIDEPILEIDAGQKQKKEIQLTQQLVQIYPAIESLLERFNIQHFSINRASLDLSKSTQSALQLRFIDLLIEKWNVKNLSPERQLLLKIGEQDLSFGKRNFSFSQIAYDFQKRQLQFSNFRYASQDSVTQSKTEINGDFLILEKLDYIGLMQKHILTYEKAKIINPVVLLHLKLQEKKSEKTTNENELIATLVKQAIGECSIDSVIISNARINAILAHKEDSISINIPSLDFRMHTLKVESDSTNLQIGEIEFKLDKPSIILNSGIEFNCSKLNFDRSKNLLIDQAIVIDTKENKKIASCESVKLRSFRILQFIFYQKLLIESISLNNADISLTQETFKSSKKNKNSSVLKDLAIGSLEINHTGFNYSGSNIIFSVENISLDIRNISKQVTKGYLYEIHNVQLDDATFDLNQKATTGHLNDLSFDGKTIKVGELIFKKDSLNLLLMGLNAVSRESHDQIQNYNEWNSIIVNQANINGKLPEFINNQPKNSDEVIAPITIEQTIFNSLSISVHTEKMHLSCLGRNLSVSAITTSPKDKPNYGKVLGQLSNVKYTTTEFSAGINEINVHLPDHLFMKSINFEKDDLKVTSNSALFQSVTQAENMWSINNITLNSPDVITHKNKLINADSIQLSDFRIFTNSDPSLGNIEIYNPDIRMPEEEHNKNLTTKNKNYPINIINNFTIHPGIIQLKNNKTIDFGLIQGNLRDRKVWCASFYTEIEKLTLQVNSLHLSQNKLMVDSFFIKPNEEWYANNNIQDTRLNTSIFGLQTTGFSLDSILSSGKIMDLAFSIDSSNIQMLRDKRLPDPPEIEKSASLSGLFWLPENMSIHTLNIKKTNIRYIEVSKKTGEPGVLELNDLSASAILDYSKSQFPSIEMTATSKLYEEGIVNLNYGTVDSMSFSLDASVNNFDLTKLNKIVVPTQSLEIKSGYLNEYNLHIIANNDTASGNANITYKDLHLIIFKSDDPERKNLGSDLLTFLADGIILQHNKTNATIKVKQPRIKYKSTFNYWVKSAIHGAMGAIRKGKEIKVSIHPQVKIK